MYCIYPDSRFCHISSQVSWKSDWYLHPTPSIAPKVWVSLPHHVSEIALLSISIDLMLKSSKHFSVCVFLLRTLPFVCFLLPCLHVLFSPGFTATTQFPLWLLSSLKHPIGYCTLNIPLESIFFMLFYGGGSWFYFFQQRWPFFFFF